jgi:DNA-binding transcriptional MerR regulator
MADEGITMAAIRRIIELEQQLSEVVRHRDELAARLAEVAAERDILARQASTRFRTDAPGRSEEE